MVSAVRNGFTTDNVTVVFGAGDNIILHISSSALCLIPTC